MHVLCARNFVSVCADGCFCTKVPALRAGTETLVASVLGTQKWQSGTLLYFFNNIAFSCYFSLDISSSCFFCIPLRMGVLIIAALAFILGLSFIINGVFINFFLSVSNICAIYYCSKKLCRNKKKEVH